jgi:hypothetical protein
MSVVQDGDMDGGDERRRGDSEGSVECGEEGGVHDRGRGYRLGGLEQGYGLWVMGY